MVRITFWNKPHNFYKDEVENSCTDKSFNIPLLRLKELWQKVVYNSLMRSILSFSVFSLCNPQELFLKTTLCTRLLLFPFGYKLNWNCRWPEVKLTGGDVERIRGDTSRTQGHSSSHKFLIPYKILNWKPVPWLCCLSLWLLHFSGVQQ